MPTSLRISFFFLANFIALLLSETLGATNFAYGFSYIEQKKIPYPIKKTSLFENILYHLKSERDWDNIPLPVRNAIKGEAHPAQKIQEALQQDETLRQLKTALDKLSKGNIQETLNLRNSLPQDSLDHDILTWSLALHEQATLPYKEYIYALEKVKSWPSRRKILSHAEQAFLRENKSPEAILAFFKQKHPLTTQGVIAFAGALWATGKQREAQNIAVPFWIKHDLPLEEEKEFLHLLGPLLSEADHFRRMEGLLLRRRFSHAERSSHLAHAHDLYHLVHAALRHANHTNLKRLKALEGKWGKTISFRFAKINLLRRLEQPIEAAALMFKIPNDPEALIVPDSFCLERQVLSRELLDIGQPQQAYQIISDYKATDKKLSAEAEFLAGWYALRFLNKADIANKHFQNLLNLASKTESFARAYYWLGRAKEALEQKEEAEKAFQKSAAYGTSFYGQLAGAHLKNPAPELFSPQASEEDKQNFYQSEPVRAIQRLELIGYYQIATPLYRQLGSALKNAKQIALLIDMAQQQQSYFLALKIAKDATARGINIGVLTHPLGALPIAEGTSAQDQALAYAIARQESEFNPNAHSPAGARGMLQIIPSTARKIARNHHLAYSRHKLIYDPAYNTLLGIYYLQEQLAFFEQSYILTFAAYNAGATRVRSWMKCYGDPRNLSLNEVIDWIERIPYPETRNYVMRIVENYEIYKTRLMGKANIEKDLQSPKADQTQDTSKN